MCIGPTCRGLMVPFLEIPVGKRKSEGKIVMWELFAAVGIGVVASVMVVVCFVCVRCNCVCVLAWGFFERR